MAFTKGKSGNPGGRQKDKPWREALNLALSEKTQDGVKNLRAIADACVKAAIAGDMQAIREIGDRLDGKPALAIEHSGEVTRSYVIRGPEKCETAEQWQQQYAPTTH